MPGPAVDRSLVIARHGSATYARRFVRGANGDLIGLTAEVPDPRTRTPKTILLRKPSRHPSSRWDHFRPLDSGRERTGRSSAGRCEQPAESNSAQFPRVDDSAVPLALEKQVVLGGGRIELDELGLHRGTLVALTLDDGSSIFKRVGGASKQLAHLRQFESIGGLGSSQVLSVGKPHKDSEA